MDFGIRTEEVDGLLLHTAHGTVNLPDLKELLEAVYEEDTSWHGENSLWDFSGVSLAISFEEVEELADFVGLRFAEGASARSAIVVPGDLAFGFARVYQARVSGMVPSQVRIFRARDAALAWLQGSVRAEGSHDP